MDFNAGALNERLQSEDQDYWIHLNVSAAEVDKYPGRWSSDSLP